MMAASRTASEPDIQRLPNRQRTYVEDARTTGQSFLSEMMCGFAAGRRLLAPPEALRGAQQWVAESV